MNNCILQALQADISVHKDPLDRLEDKASQVKDSLPRSRVAELKSRYSALVDRVKVNGGIAHLTTVFRNTLFHNLTGTLFIKLLY